MLVWVLIRLSSMLVRDERLARAVAILAWIIAALNIAGLIAPVVGLLDAMAVPIGNFRLSLLLVLKGAVTLAVFIWIANVAVAAGRSAAAPVHAADAGGAGAGIEAGAHDAADAGGRVGARLHRHRPDGVRGVLRRDRRRRRLRLQKVVSNLVSGVILLMDRSIKPGDVIEIDSTYGSVDRAQCALRLGADARRQGVSDPERGPDHPARHQLVVLQRPDPTAREGRNLVSVGSARSDPAGAGGGARCAARAERTRHRTACWWSSATARSIWSCASGSATR